MTKGAELLIAGLDLETTGLDQTEGHRIIEVALVIYELGTGKERGRIEQRINPMRGIDPKAQAVHGICAEDLIGKPQWETVGHGVSNLISRCQYVVAHNGIGFDAPFLWGEFERIGVALPSVPIIDTMIQGRWATPDGAVPNLEALCFACNVEYDRNKAHGATYDVSVMMACFFKQYERGFFTLPSSPYVYKPAAKAAH